MTKDPRVGVTLETGHLSLVLNAPEASNALAPAAVEVLIEALRSDGILSCTIAGEGRNFCSGFDLSDLISLSDGDLLHRFLRIETLLQAIHHASFPVMALCHGHTIGAGADLVAACAWRVAAPNAKFKMPGWNFELALGTRRLTRLIGTDAARDMLIDTRVVLAEEAEAVGLVTEVVSRDEWSERIERFKSRSRALTKVSTKHMLSLTMGDTRAEDMASIVETAGRPGLKERIAAYRQSVEAARQKVVRRE